MPFTFSNNVTKEKYAKSRIANALRELAMSGLFRSVVWDENDLCTIEEKEEGVTPISVSCNEVEAPIVESANRRDNKIEYESFNWELFIQFSQEVNTEDFDRSLFEIIQIPASVDNYNRALSIVPISVGFDHPPRKGAETGTLAKYTLQIIPGRI